MTHLGSIIATPAFGFAFASVATLAIATKISLKSGANDSNEHFKNIKTFIKLLETNESPDTDKHLFIDLTNKTISVKNGCTVSAPIQRIVNKVNAALRKDPEITQTQSHKIQNILKTTQKALQTHASNAQNRKAIASFATLLMSGGFFAATTLIVGASTFGVGFTLGLGYLSGTIAGLISTAKDFYAIEKQEKIIENSITALLARDNESTQVQNSE